MKKGKGLGAGRCPGVFYSIDAENDVIMNSAFAFPLAMEATPQYAAEVAACMMNKIYQPWLNEGGSQFIAQQQQLAELQKQGAEAHKSPTPLKVAFSEVISCQETIPLVKNLRLSSCPLGIANPVPFRQGDRPQRILHSRHLLRLSSNTAFLTINRTCPCSSGTKYSHDLY